MTSPGGSTVVRVMVSVWLVSAVAFGQPANPAPGRSLVPPLVKFGGVIPGGPGTLSVNFGLFEDPEGGVPIWSETQDVVVDASGRYSVVLGATRPEGLPPLLFAGGEPRWVSVRADGRTEMPRTALVSVAYALKAGDADTIGGKPLSAFVLAGDKTGVGADGLTYVDTRVLERALAPAGGANQAATGTPGALVKFAANGTDLASSGLSESASGWLGVQVANPQAPFHVASNTAPAAFFDVYSNGLGALPVVSRAARGTPAAPSAVQADDILGGLAVRGFATTRFSAGRGQVMFKAAENWTDLANGTYLQFTTTPLGSTVFAERLRIAPNGFVGVGASAPAFPLDVRPARGATHVRVGPDAGAPLFLMANQPAVGFNAYAEGGWHYGAPGASASLAFNGTSGSLSVATAPSGAADALVSMTPRLTILNGGNVGVGTTLPLHTLEVAGTFWASGAVTGGAGTFTDSSTDGFGVYGTAANGVGVAGRSQSATGAGGEFTNTAATGKALRATVNGTEVMHVDSGGIHAGPGMVGTPVAIGTVDNTGALRAHSSNVTVEHPSMGNWRIWVQGASLSDAAYVPVVVPSGVGGWYYYSYQGDGSLLVLMQNSNGTWSNGAFSFLIFKI